MLCHTGSIRHALALLGLALLVSASATVRADLFSYVDKPDDAFTWELRGVEDLPQGKVYDLHLVSQVWQGFTWEHQLQVYEPNKLDYPDVLGLFITGGGAGDDDKTLGLTVANFSGARLATLYHVPKQPLFSDLREDALISYTWMKYLETGDEDWVLLFPMVKSAVRAMDCLEQFASRQWQTELRGFIVAGASKRGWTTYLTGAVDPERVLGIAPMVFDILNLGPQIDHQKAFWGEYSEQIADYTEKGLQNLGETGRGFRLFWMVDPYSYRYRLPMPKLVILGSNDPYWPVDAVNLYWRGLSYPKALLIAPNSGHGLDDTPRVLGALSSFIRCVITNRPIPAVLPDFTESPDSLRLAVSADATPIESRLWVARSAVRDFRQAKWLEQALSPDGGAFAGSVARAEGEYTAVYGELVFDVDGRKFYTSTQPCVLHPR